MSEHIVDKPPRWTVFDTPVLGTVLRWISLAALHLAGWRSRVELPSEPKCVLIVAPHTSYWDFPILLATALKHRIRAHWLGKHTLFRGPFRPLFRWLGGIPVDPTQRGRGRVAAIVDVFRSWDRIRLGIAPEATLSRVHRWRTGFYHIALGAGVPVVLGFIDYGTKTVATGDCFMPSGDIDADFKRIRAFYAKVRGRHPHRFALPLPNAETD
jgi:1-acyl-sn-glycerol-3-phosphate acyltransferase